MDKYSSLRIITQSLIFAAKCELCDTPISSKPSICSKCLELLPYSNNYCMCCGLPLKGQINLLTCGKCLINPPPFNHLISSFWYQAPLKRLIYEFKFKQKLYLAPILGRYMAKIITLYYQNHNLTLPELLIPVPLHSRRIFQRGYNQATELTKELSYNLNIEYNNNLAHRIKHTKAQARLGALKRKKNISQAFKAKPCTIKSIAIIDDIVTTGLTVSELSKTLKKQGINNIDIWCLARTLA